VINVVPIVVGSLLCFGGFAASAWLAFGRSDQPGRTSFLLLQATLAVTLICHAALALSIPFLSGLWTLFAIEAGVYASLALWGVFAVAYIGRGPLVSRARAIGLGLVVVLTVGGLVLLTFWDIWFDAGASSLLREGTYYSVVLLHILLLCVCLYGVFLLVWSVLGEDELSTQTGSRLACCGLLLVVLRLVLAPDTPSLSNLATTGLVFLLLAGGFFWTQLRYRPFDGPPEIGRHLARDSVFDAMSDAVIAVDHDRRVVDANIVAERTFGVRLADVVERPLDEVVGYDPDEQDGDAADPVSLKTTEGQRSFRSTRSQLDGEEDEGIGRVYVFRDVTDERTQQQQLEVLNRVLRHNLRNDLDAIRGFAETLGDADAADIDTTTIPDRIHSLSRELSEMGATVERAERLRTRETLARDPTDVDGLLESLAAEVRRNHPDCTVSVSTADTYLRTDETVLETVLREVVENAIEHNDGDPSVTVTVSATEDDREWIELTVLDDGPGIPEDEREVLAEGEETALHHGSGLGLWLTNWIVGKFGGELSFDDYHTSGGTVTLRLQRAVEDGASAQDVSALGTE